MAEAKKTPDPSGDTADRDGTRERIVSAALAEFSQHGVAGARMDRIAQRARTSKERLYAHFRGKDALYAQTAERELVVIAEAARLDPADLPGYAGKLFDYFETHPDHFRLISWGRLELDSRAHSRTTAAVQAKVDELRRAQDAGVIDASWDPVDILALVNNIATTWTAQPDLDHAAESMARDTSRRARRAAVVRAVEALFPRAADTPASSRDLSVQASEADPTGISRSPR